MDLGSKRVVSRPLGRWEKASLVALVLVAADLLFRLATAGFGLSREEALHAIAARALAGGAPATGVDLHIPLGMKLIAVPGIILGGSPAALRLFPVVIALAALILFFVVGRSFSGARAALATIAGIVLAAPILPDAASLAPAMPAFALELALLWLVARELERPGGPTRRLFWAAPIAAAAFYLLYSTLLVTLVVALAAWVCYREALGRSRRLAARTALAYGGLLLPHFLYAAIVTVRPYTLLWRVGRPLWQQGLGAGWRQLWEGFPDQPAGAALGGLALVGLVFGAVRIARRDAPRRERFAWLVAVGTLALFATLIHLGSEHLLLPVALLALAGARPLDDMAPPDGTFPILGALAVIFAVYAAPAGEEAGAEMRRRSNPPIFEAVGAAIHADGEGACSILSTYDVELTWTSGCATYRFQGGDRVEDLPPGRRYVVLFEPGYDQPEGSARRRLLEQLEPDPELVKARRRHPKQAAIYRAARGDR